MSLDRGGSRLHFSVQIPVGWRLSHSVEKFKRLFGERFKMTMKLSVETFVAVVRKSGLLENERLQRAVVSYSKVSENQGTAVGLAEWLIAENVLTPWQAEKLLQGKHRGYFLGTYKLQSLLGKGGLSSVYLAEHLLMRRQCALKVLPAKRVDDSSYLERFHREAQAAALLNHPNIVRAYDVDHQEEGDRQIHFLVMEYVEGSSLQALVPEKGIVCLLDAAEYARQAALGLQHAHEHGMVHRDIKPGNLLVDLKGVVKILDLGLARFFKVDEGSEALTLRHDEKVLGTADYLAPEQALDSHTVDARADIYSLGCTLYFMVTGQPPFTEGTLAQRLLAHQVKTPTPAESLRTDLPLSLAAIIKKMMEKKPSDRYSTAAELEKALFIWVDENADITWRQAHFNIYGSRSADTGMSQPVPPVAPPISTRPTTSTSPRILAPGPFATSEADSESLDSQSVAPEAATSHSNEANDTSLNLFLSTLAQPKQDPAPPPQTLPNPITATLEKSDLKISPTAVMTPENPSKTDSPASASQPPFFQIQEPSIPNGATETPAVHLSNDTIPASPRRIPVKKQKRSPLIPLAGLVAMGLLAVYMMGGFGFRHKPDQNSQQVLTPFPPDKHEVTVGTKSSEYKSIRDALIAVRNRYRPSSQSSKTMIIKVAAGTYAERIRIDGHSQSWPEGIKLQGVGEVRLAPTGDGPVIRLANISRFSIENIWIDASDKKVAVELADDLHESRLSQIILTNFSDTGILCKGIQGLSFANSQFLLDRIRFEPADPQANGIRLESSAEHDVNNIIISNCRFLQPMAAGIVIQGQSPYGIEISHCIFNDTNQGILFEGEPLLKLIRVTNNSFRKTKTGIAFFKLPKELSAELVFRRNLFLETREAEAVVKFNYDEAKFRSMISSNPPGIQDNWSDRPKPAMPAEGEIAILFENQGRQGEQMLSLASTDPKEAGFLAPTEKSPHKDIGGAQGTDSKWIGAIGP